MENLVINCLQAAEEEYDEDYHNEEKMEADVAALYEMGQGSWGTDEKGFFKILCASPPEYMSKLNLAYAEKHGFTLLKVRHMLTILSVDEVGWCARSLSDTSSSSLFLFVLFSSKLAYTTRPWKPSWAGMPEMLASLCLV